MRLLAAALLLTLGAGCATSGQTPGVADYETFSKADRVWRTSLEGIRRNVIPATDPVSFNVVMFFPNLAYSPAPREPQLAVWTGYGGADTLGLGEGSTLVLDADGWEVQVGSARSPYRQSLFDNRGLSTSVGDLVGQEFGRPAEFGLYLITEETARRLLSADAVAFRLDGTDGTVQATLSRDNLGHVKRFLRSPVVTRSSLLL